MGTLTKMRKLLLILALSLPLMGHAQFSTVTCTHGETGTCRQATTCNQSDVQATVNASAAGSTGVTTPNAFGGDGVYVPAGSCTWTSSVAWTNKNIEILGGVGGTTTINNTSVDTFDPVVSNNGATAAAFRISGFSFNASSSGHLVNVNQQNPNLTSWAGYFRIDDITINSTSSGNVIAIWGPVWGLIDHINVTWTGGNFLEQGDFLNSECVVSPGNSAVNYMGEYSGRILPIALGTQEAVYVEDSTLNYTGSYAGGISDSESGGQRMVFRHNTVTGSTYHYAHWTRGGDGGFCYNGEWDGHKYEIYNNTYNGGGGPALYPMRFGSGTGVIFNNTITGYSSLTLNIDETRGAGGEVTNQTPLSCDGSQPIDGNAGDASAPGWPCAGQIGFACKAGSCSRTTMDSVPLLAWNNGAQTGCSTGGSCTNTFNLTVDGCQGSGNCQPTQTRPMANYIKSTAHSVSGALNGAFDYCQGTTTAPSSCGIYTNSYAPYVYPNPLQGTSAPTVATPVITPSAGTYTATQIATMSTSTSGASIIYTTDGTTPTVTALTCTITNGNLYTGEVVVSSSQTLNAIGCLTSDNASSVASNAYTINLPSTTVVLAESEGSNSGSPDRDVYTNCAKTCSSGTPSPSPAGQRWCNSSQVVSCGSFGSNFVGSAISGTGTKPVDNGLGAGGTDSLASLSVSYGNALAGDCGTVPTTATLWPNVTLLGSVANGRSIHSGTTQSSSVNTSYLAPTKWAIPGGDAANYYIVQMCETVPTTSGTGFHLELDLNHTLSTDDYVGPGSHFDFTTNKWYYCPQGCSGWKAMNLVNGNGNGDSSFPCWPLSFTWSGTTIARQPVRIRPARIAISTTMPVFRTSPQALLWFAALGRMLQQV